MKRPLTPINCGRLNSAIISPAFPLDVFARSITFKVEQPRGPRVGVFEERNWTMSFFGEKPDFDFSLSSTLKRNWTVVVARGVFGLIIGLIAFLFPGPTLLSLVGLFAVFLIIDGILATVAAVRAASKNERWGFLTFEGIVGIVAGIIAMAMPGLTVFVFVGLLAAWALFRGRWSFARPSISKRTMAAGGWRSAGSFRLFSESCWSRRRGSAPWW